MVCQPRLIGMLIRVIDALEVPPNATDSEIKKAYRKV
jgi:curved DNA-binding protein CbpA